MLAAALAAVGHVVETCSDGLDAVWRIREGRFDIVLMDYLMPEIDGLATALHDQNPARPIYMAADNDHHLPLRAKPLPNAGREKAEATAAAVGACFRSET